jgi:hypothetical protein
MQMVVRTKLFQGHEYDLVIYNGEAIISRAFYFYTKDCDGNETPFDFPDYNEGYFKVYNERSGRRIKNLVLTRSAAYLILNASESDMTFEDEGFYYYEVGYVRAGGYETTLRYGNLKVL